MLNQRTPSRAALGVAAAALLALLLVGCVTTRATGEQDRSLEGAAKISFGPRADEETQTTVLLTQEAAKRTVRITILHKEHDGYPVHMVGIAVQSYDALNERWVTETRTGSDGSASVQGAGAFDVWLLHHGKRVKISIGASEKQVTVPWENES